MACYVSYHQEYNVLQIKILILYMYTTIFCNHFYTENKDVNNKKEKYTSLNVWNHLIFYITHVILIINVKIFVISLNNHTNDGL